MMASVNPKLETQSLLIKRVFKAPREKIFQAWTQPEQLTKWFGPEGVTTKTASIDLRVDGEYKFEMVTPDGQTIYHHGQYREIKSPEKLVFTWVLDGQICEGSKEQDAETLVTVELKDLGDSTEMVLSHECLPSDKAREGHEFGWNSSLDCLDSYL